MLPGRRFGPYELVSEIGAGGMGVVWRAHDERLGRDVALKFLPPELAAKSDALERFRIEARAVAALSHPNIVSIFDIGTDDGASYVVTELLEGENLAERIARGPLDWREAASIAAEVADGLAAAHAKDIVHRDLKPENVILTRDRAKIVDFGLAKLPIAAGANEKTTPRLTQPGTVMGTVGYVAPEQLRGEAATAKSDIFAFGCVLYEMLSGTPAFTRASAAETISAILRDPPPDASKLTGVPPLLGDIVSACLERNALDRDLGAAQIAAALRALLRASEPDQASQSLLLPRRRRRLRPILFAAIVLFLVAAALAGVFAWRRAHATRIDSLAVLPFAVSGNQNEIEYIGDGITESLINNLSQFSRVRVMSNGSVLRYRGAAADPRRVGADLDVDAVVTGRVTQFGERLSISAELVNAKDASHIWGEQYEVPSGELMEIEQKIAGEISDHLSLASSGEDRKRLTRATTENSEAYRLYLLGRYHWNKFTPEGFNKAVEYFQKAIAVDPQYALAWSGLADSYLVLGIHVLPPREVMPKAKEAALKAVEIDPDLAEAHTSLGAVFLYYDWNWDAAGRELRKAVELKPGYATGHHAYSLYLRSQGRSREAMQEINKALDLDPFSLVINIDASLNLFAARDYGGAIQQMTKTIELHPASPLAENNLGILLQTVGRIGEAIPHFQRSAELAHGDQSNVAKMREGFERGGARGYWEARLEIAKGRHVPLATAYGNLGELDRGIAEVELAIADRDNDLIYFKVMPMYDPLRKSRKYPAVLRELGLE